MLVVASCIELMGCHLPEDTSDASSNLASIQPQPIPANPKSGYHYQNLAEQSLQDDNFANPGYLWVDEGKVLFESQTGTPACNECHTDSVVTEVATNTKNSWRSAAARYPAFDPVLDRVIALETRINQCRVIHQQLSPLAFESREMLALSAFVAHQAKGKTIQIHIDEHTQESLDRGAEYYHQRRGQLNLACRHCHEQNAGQMLRGDRLSEGLPTGYPAYTLKWQALGSLQRRLRDCDVGVRATPHEFGSQAYADLSLYLKWRANGLPIETPAVRR